LPQEYLNGYRPTVHNGRIEQAAKASSQGAKAPPQGDEREAREEIDRLLTAAGWSVCDVGQQNLAAYRGVAIREFPLPGQGFAFGCGVLATGGVVCRGGGCQA